MPTPSAPAGSLVCRRCRSPLDGNRRQVTGLDGGTVCEPCQYQELDELIEQLEHTPPGPALPANLLAPDERRRAAPARSGA